MAPIAPLKIIVAPAAKAIAKIGSTMTYDDVPVSYTHLRAHET